MNEDLDRFIALLSQATAAIESGYFMLLVAGQDAPILRERVYAYELYHQLRRIWPTREAWPFVLNGEVDKRRHPVPEMQGADVRDRIPDLLIHCPGDMGGNLVIVEIKPSSLNSAGLSRDIRKLVAFCGAPDYQLGILLIFGRPADDDLRTLVESALETECPPDRRDRVRIYVHGFPGESASQIA